MSTEIPAKQVRLDGLTFDSVLECDWYVTLDSWGMKVKHHPGSVRLKDTTEWQPDFMVAGSDGEAILCEVKGPHDDRLWKAYQAQAEHTDLGVVILRPGLVPAWADVEEAGAVWHSTMVWGLEWVVAFDDHGRARFTRSPEHSEDVRVSAERAMVRPDAVGIAMGKS